MIENFQDAVAISRVFGPPDLFTTFTCNPKWPEITEALCSEPGQMPSDRADLPVRVYHMKLNDYIHDIKSGEAFGPVIAGKTCFAIPLISFLLFFSTSARDCFLSLCSQYCTLWSSRKEGFLMPIS